MAYVPDLQCNQVTAPQLAVDAQVEKCKLSDSVLHLQTNTKRPDILDFERGLLTHDFSLVPRLAMDDTGYGFHDGLPSS